MICNDCVRKCGVDRSEKTGFCGCGENIRVSRAMRHFWEEPCISGTNGSGTVFFSGCNLKCIYCQNYTISRGCNGKSLTKGEFQSLVLNICASDVHNINLVTPSHFTSQLASALSEIKHEIKIPVVWNSSGYESAESISKLSGIVDVFLCDIKYFSDLLSKEYSSAPDYFNTAMTALGEMVKITGKPKFSESGILEKGVIVRHLLLPGTKEDSLHVLESLKPFKNDILLSLMCQYTPTVNVKNHKFLSRRTTSLEYSRVVDFANECGFEGYIQERSSAKQDYTPDFTLKWDFLP